MVRGTWGVGAVVRNTQPVEATPNASTRRTPFHGANFKLIAFLALQLREPRGRRPLLSGRLPLYSPAVRREGNGHPAPRDAEDPAIRSDLICLNGTGVAGFGHLLNRPEG